MDAADGESSGISKDRKRHAAGEAGEQGKRHAAGEAGEQGKRQAAGEAGEQGKRQAAGEAGENGVTDGSGAGGTADAKGSRGNGLQIRRLSGTHILIFLVSCGILTGLVIRLFFSGSGIPAGTWRFTPDLAAEAGDSADAWLPEAGFGETLSPLIAGQMPAVTVELAIDRNGGWERRIDRASYETAYTAAYAQLQELYIDYLAHRIREEGYGEKTPQEIEALFMEEYGIGIAAYLAAYGPEILPSPEALDARYGGSGSCRRENGRLFLTGSAHEQVVRDGDTLVLIVQDTGETAVYEKK